MDDEHEPQERWRWTIERATLTGLALSLCIHLIILLIAFIIRFDRPGDGGQGTSPEPVEFAVLPESELESSRQLSETETEVETLETEIQEQLEIVSEETDSGERQSLTDELVSELESGGGSLSSFAVEAGASGSGTGTSFFGLEASGKRFAYIVDRSGSMNQLMDSGELSRWQRTQHELIRSVRQLGVGSRFFIMLYSSQAQSLYGNTSWIKASDTNKASTGAAITRLRAAGDTRPWLAFEEVFRLDPKPDAIFFMTDGEFESRIVEDIARMNSRRRIPVHCILLGRTTNAESMNRVTSMMQNISTRSGGRFRHIRTGGP